MSIVGQSADEALHLVGRQSNETDQLRTLLQNVGNTVQSLAGASYISATTQALMAKFEGETRPQFEKAINHSEASQAGTRSAVQFFQATQDQGAGSIQAI